MRETEGKYMVIYTCENKIIYLGVDIKERVLSLFPSIFVNKTDFLDR